MDLIEFTRQFEDVIQKEEKTAQIISRGRVLLDELASNQRWFQEFLRKIILDADFRRQQRPSRWMNEFMLHRSGSMVVLAYIWEPNQVDVIHDHSAWGIIGTLAGNVGERKYRRLDDGKKEGYARLEEVSYNSFLPGRTTSVLALNGGIHRMENLADISVSINVYGKAVRKGYVNYYDKENNSVTRAYIYPLHRTALAIKALGTMGGGFSESALKEAANQPVEDPLMRELQMSLAKLQEE